jgi:hypothetical protein
MFPVMGRQRPADADKTVRRRVNVAAAFAAPEGSPLDAVPKLLLPRAQIPWAELGDLATKLLLRVDGTASMGAIGIAMSEIATPKECAFVLATLAQRDIIKLVAKDETDDEIELDIDLSAL